MQNKPLDSDTTKQDIYLMLLQITAKLEEILDQNGKHHS